MKKPILGKPVTLKHLHVLLLISIMGCDKKELPHDIGLNARPNADNTGIQKGITLNTFAENIPVTGNIAAITDSDQIFENLSFKDPGNGNYYVFYGNNLILKNCKIPNGLQVNGTNVKIEHCEVTGGISCSGAKDVSILFNNISHFTQGVYVASDSGQASNIKIENNFIHTPDPPCEAHSDGIQVRGVKQITIANNTVDMGPWKQVCGLDAYTAAVFIQDVNGGNENVMINHNYMNGGGRILLLTRGNDIKITNNRFGRVYQYGVYGNDAMPGDITKWENNVFDDNEEPITLN
ncbi:right-handed parallel beta-helix repeat-containing protein [Flagellimonas olearia]|nr:right-handed parallel beta-helix repeat-containing protein [Allomuricauda olearia]